MSAPTSNERLWSGCKQNDTGYHRPNSEGVCSDCDATRADKALLDVASTLRLMVSSGVPIKDGDLLELARSCELDAKANAHETSDALTEAHCYEGEKDYQIDQLLDYLHYDPDTRSHPDWVARAQAAEAELAALKANELKASE